MIKQLSKFLWGVVMVFSIPLFSMAQTNFTETNQVTFSGYDILYPNGGSYNRRITHYKRSLSALYKVDYQIANNNIRENDYFIFKLPKSIQLVSSITNLKVKGKTVASQKIDDKTNTVSIIFNKNIEDLENVSGTFAIPFLYSLQEGTNDLENGINIEFTYVPETIRPVPPPTGERINRLLRKHGTDSPPYFYGDDEIVHHHWTVQINESGQNLGNSSIIISDYLRDNQDNPHSTYITENIFNPENTQHKQDLEIGRDTPFGFKLPVPFDFILQKGRYTRRDSDDFIFTFEKYIPIVTNEEEYNSLINQNKEVAFLKLKEGGSSFDLFLGNNTQDYGYLLKYRTYNQQNGSDTFNNTSIYADDILKPAFIYRDTNTTTPVYKVSSNLQNQVDLNIIYGDEKDRVILYAYDADTGIKTPIVGAILRITNLDTGDTSILNQTNEKGEAISPFRVPVSSFIEITEVSTPTGYYIRKQKFQFVTVRVQGVENTPYKFEIPYHKIPNFETIDYTVNIKWEGGTEPRPDVILILERDGVDYLSSERKTITNYDDTTFSWKYLPKQNPTTGKEYIYTVRQAPIVGYNIKEITSTPTSSTIINQFSSLNHTTTIVWEGGTEPRPTVNLTLKQDETPYRTQRISNGTTSYIWQNLPIFNGNSFADYTVEVASIDKYTVKNITYGENSSQITIAPAVCTKPAITTGTALETIVGISDIRTNTDEWPHSRKGGWIALESNNKGFVINRLSTAQIRSLTHPQEGMIAYDTTEKCLKIFNGTEWKCFSNPVCPQH